MPDLKSISLGIIRKPRFKIFFLLVLTISTVFYLKKTSGEILVDRIKPPGILGQLKKIGLVKATVPGYFKALQTQNLFYDYDGNGVVDGFDYVPVLEETETAQPKVKGISTSEIQPLAAAGETEVAPQQLPSTKGFGGNDFNGEATVSYGIEVPAGPAGLAPSLGVSYSSGSVDDLMVGTDTKWRNDPLHPYQAQAGKTGLGWNLSGIQYIARDMKNDINDTGTDGFFLSFSGGAASLVKESDNGSYSVWRTVPNLKIKVERWALCKDSGGTRLICRHHWLVTTGDGTKYTFGSPLPVNNWARPKDPEIEPIQGKAGSFPGPWYPLYDDTPEGQVGTRTWMLFAHDGWRRHALETKWLLYKVESVFDTPTASLAEMNFAYRLAQSTYKDQTFVQTFYPYKITYGKHEITFTTEPRLDYFIHNGEWGEAAKQSELSRERLKKIIVKTLGKVARIYVFDYTYGWSPGKHKDDGDGLAETAAEVVSGQVIHSLLTKITQYAGDPATGSKSLPAYTFSYGPDTSLFKGGAPLTSYISVGSDAQIATANDFFLKKAGNGMGGSTAFIYWQDTSGRNALPVKYCDPDKLTQDKAVCMMDHAFNTQRRRLSATLVSDGTGNTFRTEYEYTGEGAAQGLAYVEKYGETEIKLRLPPSKFEFLGYPEVVTTSYEKNSTTKVVAKSKTFYRQAMESGSCFKPSPMKGMAYKAISFDANNPARMIETSSSYTIRIGPMFGPWEGYYDWNLNDKCPTYDTETTVSLIIPRDTVNKEYVNNAPVLCTRTFTNHRKIDQSDDPYAQLHIMTDFGKVSCSDPNQDDPSDIAKLSYTDYTAANTVKWLLPKANESWIGKQGGAEKFNHSRIFYDLKPFGTLGNLGRATSSQVLVNDIPYAASSTSYDPTYQWLPVKNTDPLGKSTVTTYDGVFHAYPVKTTNHLGQSTSTEYDFNTADTAHPNYRGVLGLPIKQKDANGKTSVMVYDSFGRNTATYMPGKAPGAGVKADTFNKYYYYNETEVSPCNDSNNCLAGLGKQVAGRGPKLMVYSGSRYDDSGTAGKVSGSHTYYNGIGQIVQSRQLWYEGSWTSSGIPVGKTSLSDLVKTQVYNALGNLEYQSLNFPAIPYVPNGSNSYITPGSNIRKIKYTYDGLGRLVSTLNPDGTSETTVYDVAADPLTTEFSNKNCTDGNPQSQCAVLKVTKDVFGQTLKVEETALSKVYRQSYQYHPVLGLPTKTFDTLGNVINAVQYDVLGRKTAMWDVDMSPAMTGSANSWKYAYNKTNNLVTQTNPKGEVATLAYDGLSRLIAKTASGTQLLKNSYDNCPNGIGKICRVDSYDLTSGKLVESVVSEYDALGRIVKSSQTNTNIPDSRINNQVFATSYTYDRGGRVLNQTRSGNTALSIPAETLNFTYNRVYLSSIKGKNTYVSNAYYNLYGQLTQFTSGNGINNNYIFDGNNQRLTALKISGANLAAGDNIQLAYKYDPLGNILGITDTSAAPSTFNLTQSFNYDELSRVKNASGAYIASYQYDDLNNLLRKTEGPLSTNMAYGAYGTSVPSYHRPQTVTASDGKNYIYSYDKLGNLRSDSQRSYLYDKDNRLAKITPIDPSFKETTFYYDAGGSRIAKLVKGEDSTYYINPELEIILKADGKVDWRQNYFFAGKLVAVRDNSSAAPTPTSITATPALSGTPIPSPSQTAFIPTATGKPSTAKTATPAPRKPTATPTRAVQLLDGAVTPTPTGRAGNQPSPTIQPVCACDGLSYSGDFFLGKTVNITAFAKALNQNSKVLDMTYYVLKNGQEVSKSRAIPTERSANQTARYQTAWDFSVPETPGSYKISVQSSCVNPNVLGVQDQKSTSMVDTVLNFLSTVFFLNSGSSNTGQTQAAPTIKPAVPTGEFTIKLGSFIPVQKLKLSCQDITFSIQSP